MKQHFGRVKPSQLRKTGQMGGQTEKVPPTRKHQLHWGETNGEVEPARRDKRLEDRKSD